MPVKRKTAKKRETDAAQLEVQSKSGPMVYFREYQREVFADKTTKVLILEWSRQIGKSYTLANWAVDRLLLQLADPNVKSKWDIVVVSNSRANGSEFGSKVAEAANIFRAAIDELQKENEASQQDLDEFGLMLEDFQFKLEVKIKVHGAIKTGRIIVLSASPRTARGYSGDLILDEFAFHENAKQMWAAAEPIISSRKEYLCRIASTHNGPGSLFNKWIKTGLYPVSSWSRSRAWRTSRHDPVAPLIITSLRSGKEITPEEARTEASDQNEYDQNYENIASSESGSLLSWDEITSCTTAPDYQEDTQGWSWGTLDRLAKDPRPMFAGMDVGRKLDLSVIYVLRVEPNNTLTAIASLTMGNMDFTSQKMQVELLFEYAKNVRRIGVDSSGMGVGLVDQLIRGKIGYRCEGINFSSYVPIPVGMQASGRKEERIPVTEAMALRMKEHFADKILSIPPHNALHQSLHTPEKVVSSDGTRIRIASSRTRDESGYLEHADRFWAIALALHVSKSSKMGSFTREDVDNVVSDPLLFSSPQLNFQ